MRLISEVNEGYVVRWNFGDYNSDIEVMNDFCEGFNEKSPYLIDEVIGDLEEVGSTKAKSWNLFNDIRGVILKVDFKNGFYICFGVGRIAGRVY